MTVKHKHDEIIRAWLDGKTVEVFDGRRRDGAGWRALPSVGGTQCVPMFSADGEYRIKPEDRIVTLFLYRSQSGTEYSGWKEGAVSQAALEVDAQYSGCTLVTSYQARIPQ